MPTQIYRFDGTLLTTVTDGTLDSTHATIRFPGKGYQNYGQPINENILWVMQNFAGTTAPSLPLSGQCWYDTNRKILKVYNGLTWDAAGSAIQSSSAPAAGSNPGALWYDTTNLQLYTWTGSAWNLVGPLGSGINTDPINAAIPGNSRVDSIRISDGSTAHQVWRITVGGTLLAIFSKDQQFTPNPAITGFPVINPGINYNQTISNVTSSGDTVSFKNNQSNLPNTDSIYDLGSPSYKFSNFYSQQAIFNTAMAVNAGISSYNFTVSGDSQFDGPAVFKGNWNQPPITIQSNTLVTSPSLGMMEFDGNNFYLTSNINGSTTRFVVSAGASGVFNSNVSINSSIPSTSSSTGALVVSGGAGISGNVVSNSQILASSFDTNTRPGFSWVNDTDTGIFHPSNGNLAITVNGNTSVTFNSSGAIAVSGSYGSSGAVLTSNGENAAATWTSAAAAIIPTGVVVPYAGSTSPSGWLICDGSAISRTTYSALFAAIGVTYGNGDTTTTFNLPDLRNRVPAGLDTNPGGGFSNRITTGTAGFDGQVLGAAGGLQSQTLTVNQLPAHGHPFRTSAQSGGGSDTTGGFMLNTSTTADNPAFTGTLSNTVGQQIGASGGGAAHPNVQPTIIMNYIIKF